MLAEVKGRVMALAPAPPLLLALLGMLGHALSFSVTDKCLHIHTQRLVHSREGEDIALNCLFQYTQNFSLEEVHVLWGKELAADEYSALVIFNGRTAKTFNEKAIFTVDSLKDGKASITMKNASTADSGTYLCDVTVSATNSKGRIQVQVIRAGLVCDEDLHFGYKDQQSSPAYGFTNRSIGAIVAVVMLMLVVLSAVVYVKCKKTSHCSKSYCIEREEELKKTEPLLERHANLKHQRRTHQARAQRLHNLSCDQTSFMEPPQTKCTRLQLQKD